MARAVLLSSVIVGAFCANAAGRGVTPYLPLNLEPEIERQIERVLILADEPVLTRPIAAARVFDALPKACEADAALCIEVRRYLSRYMESLGVTHLGLEAAATSGADKIQPNRYGLDNHSAWQASGRLYWQPSDYLLVNLGGIAYEGDSAPSGSFVSLGFSYAQLDIGYRDHWLSPLTDSSMLMSTQAPTMPSATLSNYLPMTRLGLRYEVFAARESNSTRIAFDEGFTTGHPKVAGIHLSIEPTSGWSLGINRIMQYGGGARDESSIRDIFNAFWRPSRFDNSNPDLAQNEEFGNQLASFNSRFLFPGKTPFAVYFEYAGEDTSRGRSYLLGNSALSAGIHFPRLWRAFDFTYEASEWQNGWYVNHLYGDGLTNEGHVLGHWAGDERQFNDAVGGQSHSLRLGWEPRFGGTMELRYRTLANESYSAVRYERAHDVTLRYAYPLRQFTVGAEAFAGRDVFGEDFSRVGAFIQYSDNGEKLANTFDEAPRTVESDGAELFIDGGVTAYEVNIDLADELPRTETDLSTGAHLGIGARRSVSSRSDLGVRVEFDDVDGHMLTGFRALDYRYRFAGPLALGVFLGAARYDLATPAYGLYGGVGAQWRDLVRGWDVGLDVRYATKVARDHLLPSDPDGARPDSFYDVSSATLYLSRRF